MSVSVTTGSEYNVCTRTELESWSPVAGLDLRSLVPCESVKELINLSIIILCTNKLVKLRSQIRIGKEKCSEKGEGENRQARRKPLKKG